VFVLLTYPPRATSTGHILCLSCFNNILEKSTPKRVPCCPFCREQFSADGVRIIRVDFTPASSGWSTPRANGIHEVIVESDGEDNLSAGLKSREQAKRLESKVARVAAKKCSVDEVSALHRELQDWLSTRFRPREQVRSVVYDLAIDLAIHLTKGHASYRLHLWSSVLRSCVQSLRTIMHIPKPQRLLKTWKPI
jgi:hypothetical protein